MKLLFFGVPLLALAALVIVLNLSTSGSSVPKASANTGAGVDIALSIAGVAGCDTSTTTKVSCKVNAGASFSVDVVLKDFAAGGYANFGIVAKTTKPEGVSAKRAFCAEFKLVDEVSNTTGHPPPDTVADFLGDGVAGLDGGFVNDANTNGKNEESNLACAQGAAVDGPQDNHVYKGKLGSMPWNCVTEGGPFPITLDIVNTQVQNVHPTQADQLNVTCSPPPTLTPTATPPDVPQMQKSPALSRIFLTVRKPASRCQDQTYRVVQDDQVGPPAHVSIWAENGQILSETLSLVPASINAKGELQIVSAFQFQVNYDSKAVCIGIRLNPEQTTANPSAACSIQDDGVNMPFPGARSSEQGKGIARIGCVTVGKADHFDATKALAFIAVVPTADTIQQLRPNQDNGIPVQILDKNCQLADSQGHGIPIFSCEDADIVVKYLEGDVVPDCIVNVSDTQDIAFRWGARKGSLVYQSFKDLSPSGQTKGDGLIHIGDLQAVYGRFNSTCKNPQEGPVVNPKG